MLPSCVVRWACKLFRNIGLHRSSQLLQAHPSVRMKGAEADWTPIQCTDRECSHSLMKAPHLHCPFCSQDSLFTDEILLKAHYRVKHVDKGINFGVCQLDLHYIH
ncbi:uncharacterized protein LOC119742839 isoform X1 [Patiria miniata]|uniref:C2H2-type domain-containing protein n=1 Tax=Patiria miniata TaxID=46514 RepID=A0A914BHR0_PATMI|nr:uncharacterized protein LOC119742839 isoform X1 [Patiria miniata]